MAVPVNSRSASTLAKRQPVCCGHQFVGAVFVEPEELHHALGGILDSGGGGEAGVEMGEIGRDVALDELHREVGLGVEVMEEGSLGARRLGDDLVDRRRVVALVGNQPLGNLQDPFAGRATVSGHNPLFQTERSVKTD